MIFRSFADPQEILSDKDLMGQIEDGRRENVKSRDFEEVVEDLGI